MADRFSQAPYTDVADLRRHREANARNRGLPPGSLVDVISEKPARLRARDSYPIESGEVNFSHDGVDEKAAMLREAMGGRGGLRRTYAGQKKRRRGGQAVPPAVIAMIQNQRGRGVP